ncbi:hypothetical protein EYV94_21315 [Puteibacter caeruleilacunae]|nr:hypothetical protein EYV94_21315 [Puteibacter caeruleilacunae]
MKGLTIVLFLAIYLLSTVSVAHENDVIKGTVREGSEKYGIPGVTVSVKVNDKIYSQVVSEADGKYKIAVPDSLESFTLVYSFIGMKTKEIEINRKKDKHAK